MIQLIPLVLVVLIGTACTSEPEPVRTGGAPPAAEEPVVYPEEEEEAEMLLGIQESLRVYDVAEVSRVVDEALAGEKPTEEALIKAIEDYLSDRRQRLLREAVQKQAGAYSEEELSERIGRELEERLFPVILAMEKKRLGLK